MNKREAYKLIETHYRANFNQLVKKYTPRLKSKERAEDVVQEAYTRACTYYDNIQEETFNEWFGTVLFNCLRANKKEDRLGGMSMSDEDDRTVNASGLDRVALQQIHERVSIKSGEVQDVLIRILFRGERPEDVSKLTGQAANAIRQAVFRFRQELRKDFGWSL